MLYPNFVNNVPPLPCQVPGDPAPKQQSLRVTSPEQQSRPPKKK